MFYFEDLEHATKWETLKEVTEMIEEDVAERKAEVYFYDTETEDVTVHVYERDHETQELYGDPDVYELRRENDNWVLYATQGMFIKIVEEK